MSMGAGGRASSARRQGGVPSEGVEGGKWCVFAALFRGWDADALAAIYANTATGTSTAKVIRIGTGQTVKAGHRVSDRAFKLLFVPDNTHHALAMGTAAAACLGADGSFDARAWEGVREGFRDHVVED